MSRRLRRSKTRASIGDCADRGAALSKVGLRARSEGAATAARQMANRENRIWMNKSTDRTLWVERSSGGMNARKLRHLGFAGFIGFIEIGRNDGNSGLLGFKLIFRLAQHQEVVEGALIHDMEAGLITTEVGELRSGGQFGEGSGDAGEFGAFGLGGGGRFEEVILDSPVAAEAPISRDHFLDHAHLDIIEGAETIHVETEQFLKGVAGFLAEDDAIGQAAAADGVAGTGFALRGFGSAGKCTVGAGCEDTFLRNHAHLVT